MKNNKPKQKQIEKEGGVLDSLLGGCIYIACVAFVVIINKNRGYY